MMQERIDALEKRIAEMEKGELPDAPLQHVRRQKEDLQTLEPRKVKMYVCGPPHNFIHLGNARPLVVFDTVRRYLAYRGYQVTYVQNFTDVDDKIINRANEEG